MHMQPRQLHDGRFMSWKAMLATEAMPNQLRLAGSRTAIRTCKPAGHDFEIGAGDKALLPTLRTSDLAVLMELRLSSDVSTRVVMDQ